MRVNLRQLDIPLVMVLYLKACHTENTSARICCLKPDVVIVVVVGGAVVVVVVVVVPEEGVRGAPRA